MLLNYLKYLETEIAKATTASHSDTTKDQKTANNTKRMMQDFETQLTSNFNNKLSHVVVVTAQQFDRSDDRIKILECELAFINATAASDPAAPLRAPPGYQPPVSTYEAPSKEDV